MTTKITIVNFSRINEKVKKFQFCQLKNCNTKEIWYSSLFQNIKTILELQNFKIH